MLKGESLLYNLCENTMKSLTVALKELEMNYYEADLADLRKDFDIRYAHLGCDDLPRFQPYSALEFVRWHSINLHNQFMHRRMDFEFRTDNSQNRLQGISHFKKNYKTDAKRFLDTPWIAALLQNDTTALLTIYRYNLTQPLEDKAIEQLKQDTDPIGSFYEHINMRGAIPFTLRSSYSRSIEGFLLSNRTAVIINVDHGRAPDNERHSPIGRLLAQCPTDGIRSIVHLYLIDVNGNVIRYYDTDGSISGTQRCYRY